MTTSRESLPSLEVSSNGGSGPHSSSPNSVNAFVTRKELTFARCWDVNVYPPKNTYRGALVPKVFNARRRKMTLELHRITNGPPARKSLRGKGGLRFAISSAHSSDEMKMEEPEKGKSTSFEECVIRFWRYSEDDEDEDVLNSEKDLTKNFAPPNVLQTGSILLPDSEGYKARYWLPMKVLTMDNVRKNSVVITDNHMKISRMVGFLSPEDCSDFVELFEKEEINEQKRIGHKIQASLGGLNLKPGEMLNFLIEIVSGWDIPAGDFNSSDPFVVCSMNGEEVHRTQHIPKTLDPIWTLKSGSLFLLTVDSRELFTGDGLHCLLMDFDQIGANEKLGCITVPPNVLYAANGERMVFKLQPISGMDPKKVKGCLAVRCRRATNYDKEFMKSHMESEAHDTLGVGSAYETAQNMQGGKNTIRSILSKTTKIEKDGPNAGVKVYKIRPLPDPKRKEETEWLSDSQIQAECLLDSHHWTESGSGKLGRLYVEILGCDDLPNLDSGGFLGNKTDTFVTVVFEDSVLRTDVVDDCLSPRWLPWTKRAFIFNMIHSSSELFIGIFDFDVIDDHDMIGRITIDVPNLRKNTTYVLKYGIFTTAKMSNRKRRGFVKVRIRLEIDNDRKFILANLEPPPQLYVNVKTKKDFRVVRATCWGKQNMDTYNMKVINSHIEELLAYQHAFFYIQDGFTALLLWRGHFELKFFGMSMMFPLHSLVAFLAAIVLIEKPQLWPSFFFLSLGWLLLAVMGYRRSQPDVWTHCKSYGEMAKALIFGDSMTPPDEITPYQNYEESQKYLEYWKKRVSESEEAAAAAFEETQKAQEEYEKEMNEIGETTTDISTKQSNLSMDPFKPLLFPIQQNLGLLLQRLRYIRFVLFWEECYFSFWICTACFVLAFAFLFVPWIFILKWTTRIITWAIFGPWMKLIDIFYFSQQGGPTEEELETQKKLQDLKRKLATTVAVEEARIKREDAQKLKAMKTFMFGKFIIKVPILKQDRYRDSPLPESSAVAYRPEPASLAELAMKEAGYRRTRLPGQHLVGDMIPRVASIAFTDAPTGQATLHPDLLDRNSSAANLMKGSHSTTSAYIRLGSVFIMASVLTWLGVPVIGMATEMVLSWLQ